MKRDHKKIEMPSDSGSGGGKDIGNTSKVNKWVIIGLAVVIAGVAIAALLS